MTIPVSTLTVAEPQACPTCGGDREITGRNGHGVNPCPACCCYACGDPTDTPPVCRGCEIAEDVRFERGQDR